MTVRYSVATAQWGTLRVYDLSAQRAAERIVVDVADVEVEIAEIDDLAGCKAEARVARAVGLRVGGIGHDLRALVRSDADDAALLGCALADQIADNDEPRGDVDAHGRARP